MAKKGQRHELTLYRKKVAWEMRLKGKTQREIADFLGIRQQSVYGLLQSVKNDFFAAYMDDIEKVKEEHVMVIAKIASEAYESWHVSKELVSSKFYKIGDVKYLYAYLRCLADIRRITGADIKLDFNFDMEDISNLTIEQLKEASEAKNTTEFLRSLK